MPPETRKLADTILHKPVTVSVAPVAKTADRIEQSVYFVEKGRKPALLAHLVNELSMFRTIVFTRTKHGADKVVRKLNASGIRAEALHGNKTQNARRRALDNFMSSKTPVLVATDIASRGIDVDNISHVVNYDLTHEPETYVHRIGRTARAGASGQAISFCDRDEVSNLKAIEALIKQRLTRAETPAVIANAPRDVAPVDATEPRHQHQQQRMHAQPPRRSERPSHGHPAHPRRPVHPSAIDRDGSRPQRPTGAAPAKPAASTTHFVGGGVKSFGGKSFAGKPLGAKSKGPPRGEPHPFGGGRAPPVARG
ncbi:MAG TPA: DEAD/DEAH box helicase [Tepidisphaeraceae bacterium]|nr:DEAD/DEAH box helicase [Tepidisphaeraceae bacterium]